MKKITVLAAGLLLLVPCLAFPDSFSLRGGYFMPLAMSNSYLNGHSNSLWTIEYEQMSFTKAGFRGVTLGLGYEYFLGKNVNIVLTLDSFTKSQPGDYLYYDQTEFTDTWFAFPIDNEPVITDWYYISHTFKVSSTPLQVSLKFLPLGRRARFIPFVGGGAGLYFWGVQMYGEQVDFYPVDGNLDPVDWYYDYETDAAYSNPEDAALRDQLIYPVTSVNGKERGVAIGWHAFAGLEFPISYRWTIAAEARYHSARARLHEWFVDFDDFELGGLALTVGINYWF
jgi:opacity protein-like surface antigen